MSPFLDEYIGSYVYAEAGMRELCLGILGLGAIARIGPRQLGRGIDNTFATIHYRRRRCSCLLPPPHQSDGS